MVGRLCLQKYEDGWKEDKLKWATDLSRKANVVLPGAPQRHISAFPWLAEYFDNIKQHFSFRVGFKIRRWLTFYLNSLSTFIQSPTIAASPAQFCIHAVFNLPSCCPSPLSFNDFSLPHSVTQEGLLSSFSFSVSTIYKVEDHFIHLLPSSLFHFPPKNPDKLTDNCACSRT